MGSMSPRRSPLFPEIGSPRRSPFYPTSPLPSPSPSRRATCASSGLILSNSCKRMDQSGRSNSGKRMDQSAKKKYVKQVTGRHIDTELHLAAHREDLVAVREILSGIDAQMVGTESGAEFDAEVAEIRSVVVNEVNDVGETTLFTAAEKGHLDIVVELLKYSERDNVARKNRSGFDALHAASRERHLDKPADIFLPS